MAKRKEKFVSLSTPGHKMDCANYLVELAFVRQNKGRKLPAFFWREQRYKWKYGREIQACKKFVKKYGEGIILLVALENYVDTWTDFAKVEFFLQKYQELKDLRRTPKDTTEVKEETVEVANDFRDFTPPPRKKGLFERLRELNGKEN